MPVCGFRGLNTERLATALAKLTGGTKTEAVRRALSDRLARVQGDRMLPRLADDLDDIGRNCAQLPVRDARRADEILGYDEHGVPR
jgi:antitoxin VapB